MMNDFIRGLITRHLEDSNAAGTEVQFVQPRPKSRFEDLHEPSSIAGNELTKKLAQEPAPVFAEEQNFPQSRPSSKTAFVSQHTIEQPILQRRQLHDAASMPTESVHRDSPQPQRYFSEFTASPQPLLSTMQRLNTQLPFASPDTEFSIVQRLPQHELSEKKHSEYEHIAAPHFSAGNLEQRIQQIVQRLNVQPISREHAVSPHIQEVFAEQSGITGNKGSENKTLIKPPASTEAKKGQLTLAGELNQRIQEILRRSTMPKQDGDVKPSATASDIVAPAPQLAFFQPQTGRAEKQSSPSPPTAPESGLLQLPDWLNEMQTELHHRWQDSSPPAAEPVINVTIGRVEVRAMQTKAPSGPQARSQASRVMSLDEYLKQRESRG